MSNPHDDRLLGQRAHGRLSRKLVLTDEAQKLGFSTNEIESLRRLYDPHLKEQRDDE